MKSKTIADSNANEALFHGMIKGLDGDALLALRAASQGDETLTRAFAFIFDERGVSAPDLAAEIKLDFDPAKVENVNSPTDLQARQIALNTLEDRDNELRVIFAVDKLNEGWDVLNLFDIVRLYDTRDGRENKVGKTTMQEAQLIGRGARYFRAPCASMIVRPIIRSGCWNNCIIIVRTTRNTFRISATPYAKPGCWTTPRGLSPCGSRTASSRQTCISMAIFG
jgi:hypothetical protein